MEVIIYGETVPVKQHSCFSRMVTYRGFAILLCYAQVVPTDSSELVSPY